MSRPLALVLVAIALAASTMAAEAGEIGRFVLPGGLRLLVRDDPTAQVVAVSLQVRSGPRYETPAMAGLSSFVQRVMLRGTTRRSAREIAEFGEDLGGSLDTTTDAEYAEIRGTALASNADALLELIAEVALSPSFPPEEVDRERRLITSQIQTRADTAFALGLDTLNALLYGPHSLSLPTLGYKSTVERFGRDDLIEHYRRVYRAGSMVVAVSGGVSRERVRRHVESLFAQTPAGQIDEPAPTVPVPSAERRVLDRPGQQAQILMGYLGLGIDDPDYAAGKVMSAVLGGGVAGRFFVALREERGLAYSLGMLNPFRRGPGTFVAYLATSGDSAEPALSALDEEIERFRAGGPTEAELARAKAYVLGNLAMDRRTNARHAWYLAFFELASVGWDFPQRYARQIEAVRGSDVTRVARRYLARPTTVVVRPRR